MWLGSLGRLGPGWGGRGLHPQLPHQPELLDSEPGVVELDGALPHLNRSPVRRGVLHRLRFGATSRRDMLPWRKRSGGCSKI